MVPTFISAAEYEFERDWVLIQIRKTMAIRGITRQDLLPEPPGLVSNEASRVVVPDALYLKYYDVRSRQGWNGQGAQPQWLKDALLLQGQSARDLAKSARAKMYDLLVHHRLPGHKRVP